MRSLIFLALLITPTLAQAQFGVFGSDFAEGMREERLRNQCREGLRWACEELREMERQKLERQRQGQDLERQRQEAEQRRLRLEQYENCIRLRDQNPNANLQCTYPTY